MGFIKDKIFDTIAILVPQTLVKNPKYVVGEEREMTEGEKELAKELDKYMDSKNHPYE